MAIATLMGASGNSPVVAQSGLWANRAAFQSQGNMVIFTDVGGGQAGTGGGLLMRYTGTRWKIVGPGLIDSIDTANVGPATATPTNLNPNAAPQPASVIQSNDRLEIEIAFSKSAGVENGTLVLRLGSAFTTADAALATVSLSGAEISSGFKLKFKRVSPTQIQRQGSSNQQNSWGGAASLTYPAAVTLSGADNFDTTAMRFSLWQTMSVGAESVTFQDMEIILRSTDS